MRRQGARRAGRPRKFGAEVAVPVGVVGLSRAEDGHGYVVLTDAQERLRTRTVIVACGAHYREPPFPELARYEGRGVQYSASFIESNMCRNLEIAIVGGGNSAGQVKRVAAAVGEGAAAIQALHAVLLFT